MIACYQITGQHLNDPPTKYGVGSDIIQLGWSGYIDKFIRPDIEWMQAGGLKPRVLIHNPFCAMAGYYQFDQYIHARNANLVTVEGFVQAWLPLTLAGVEVINYLGTLVDDNDFSKRKGFGKGDDFMRRVLDSTSIFCNAGMSVAFDYANHFPEESTEWKAIEFASTMVRDSGGKAYIEPAPLATHPHTWRYASITQDTYFQNYESRWAPHRGETIRWADDLKFSEPTEKVAMVMSNRFKTILAEKCTPAGAVAYLRLMGYEAKEFSP